MILVSREKKHIKVHRSRSRVFFSSSSRSEMLKTNFFTTSIPMSSLATNLSLPLGLLFSCEEYMYMNKNVSKGLFLFIGIGVCGCGGGWGLVLVVGIFLVHTAFLLTYTCVWGILWDVRVS